MCSSFSWEKYSGTILTHPLWDNVIRFLGLKMGVNWLWRFILSSSLGDCYRFVSLNNYLKEIEEFEGTDQHEIGQVILFHLIRTAQWVPTII